MASFLYWIPGGGVTVPPEQIDEHGLAYAFDGGCTARTCDRGPDGQRGAVVVAGGNEDGKCGYWPSKQAWRQVAGRSAWVGMYNQNKPTPDDLIRQQQVTGVWIDADDGSRWLAPIARKWHVLDDQIVWDYNLPRRLTLNDDGLWVPGEVKPRYERIWQLAMDYEATATEALAKADSASVVRFRYDDMDLLAISALQVNYRIGPIELDMLGVYDDQLRQRIVDVLLDNDTWQDWIKKKVDTLDTAGSSS